MDAHKRQSRSMKSARTATKENVSVKEEGIEVQGTIVEKHPGGTFSVALDEKHTVLAQIAGKLRKHRIRILTGDRVNVELSPYDLTRGRIIYRYRS